MNYKVDYIDWMQSGLSETTEDVDNINVFSNYQSAKERLLQLIIYRINELKERVEERVTEVRNLTKEDLVKLNR